MFRDDYDLGNRFRSYLHRKESELSRTEFFRLTQLIQKVVVEQKFELLNEETCAILSEFVETVLKFVSRREIDDAFSRLSVGSSTRGGGEGSFDGFLDGPVR